MRTLLSRLLSPLRRARHDQALDDELASHIEFQTEDNLRAGMSPAAAHRAAVLKFGPVQAIKESYRDRRHWPLFELLRLDLRFALRMLRRSPAIGWSAIAVLALGLAAATTTYALVYAMWLRPLPYPHPEELVSVSTWLPNYKFDTLVSPDYGEWQGTQSLGPLAAFDWNSGVLAAPQESIKVNTARISGNLFTILLTPPALGRAIQPSDDSPAAPLVAMLSHSLWKSHYQSDPTILGRTIPLNGQPTTLIGILPPSFRLPDERRADVLIPLSLPPALLTHGSGGSMRILKGLARRQPGMDLVKVRAELSTRLANSKARAEKFYVNAGAELRVLPLHEYMGADSRTLALVLLAAVVCILLIATTNVAGLLVARASGRQHEMAIRSSLGASRSQILRGLLTEGLLLGGLGTALGLMLTGLLLLLLPAVGGASLVSLDAVKLDPEVLAAAAAAGLCCSLCFSLAPVLPLPRLPFRRALVVLELAASMILLFGATLLFENLRQLHAVSPGFQVNHLLTASLSLQASTFSKHPTDLIAQLRDRITPTPGVLALSFVNPLPPSESNRTTTFSRSDRPAYDSLHRINARLADASYLAAMGLPLLQGRLFSPAAEAGTAREAIVNRTLAERYFPGEDPLGKQIDGPGKPWRTIVGVMEDYRNDGLRNPAKPEMVVPPLADEGGDATFSRDFGLLLRTVGDPAPTATTLRTHLRQLDPNILVTIRTMEESWDEPKAASRFQAFAFTVLAALALLMASTGIYGVLSHIVTLRRREIGIRMALGAVPRQVLLLILQEALFFALGGIGLGFIVSVNAAPHLSSLLFNVNPRDPIFLAATAASLLLLALLAAFAPARRAALMDPARTLRSE
ncbi:MAG: ADOP family duplicated permease [Acidobacteria bacterium]|nr:ADOP family duplicated permease [Acidobacteriota bacterium]